MGDSPAPRLGCAAVIQRGDTVLLGTRAKEPNLGKWVLPGGGVRFLEPLHVALRREILEETSLEIDIGRLIGAYEILDAPDEHRVILYWSATYHAGTLTPASDLSDARFFRRSEVSGLLSESACSPIVVRVLRDTGWGE